eukprot:6278611-Amphidinium_carterae.1
MQIKYRFFKMVRGFTSLDLNRHFFLSRFSVAEECCSDATTKSRHLNGARAFVVVGRCRQQANGFIDKVCDHSFCQVSMEGFAAEGRRHPQGSRLVPALSIRFLE